MEPASEQPFLSCSQGAGGRTRCSASAAPTVSVCTAVCLSLAFGASSMLAIVVGHSLWIGSSSEARPDVLLQYSGVALVTTTIEPDEDGEMEAHGDGGDDFGRFVGDVMENAYNSAKEKKNIGRGYARPMADTAYRSSTIEQASGARSGGANRVSARSFRGSASEHASEANVGSDHESEQADSPRQSDEPDAEPQAKTDDTPSTAADSGQSSSATSAHDEELEPEPEAEDTESEPASEPDPEESEHDIEPAPEPESEEDDVKAAGTRIAGKAGDRAAEEVDKEATTAVRSGPAEEIAESTAEGAEQSSVPAAVADSGEAAAEGIGDSEGGGGSKGAGGLVVFLILIVVALMAISFGCIKCPCFTCVVVTVCAILGIFKLDEMNAHAQRQRIARDHTTQPSPTV
eukprot:gnl/TRDRNA2_/TRDRNA2_156713_c0_seq2.p1 gnl/TRDRNA2_/TRDRNA2_156713_c0~~gnl/TRDRNA2_/TRDRNA2_156713_c0_seq2.p1  ORF type:complete len:403 (-),score=79.31 gnl/TRDRNA2_/TRDRNA2_156713_c0_seq2:236-1444(-)